MQKLQLAVNAETPPRTGDEVQPQRYTDLWVGLIITDSAGLQLHLRVLEIPGMLCRLEIPGMLCRLHTSGCMATHTLRPSCKGLRV